MGINVFLLVGIPGSGKTSCIEKINKKNEINCVSLGALFRSEIENKSEIGLVIKKHLKENDLVPLEVAMLVITNLIEISNKDILIDGFPRDEEQMNAFNIYLKQNKKVSLKNVIEIDIDIHLSKSRILNRARDMFDNEKKLEERIKHHNSTIHKIRNFYKQITQYHIISGNKSLNDVIIEIESILKI